MEQLTIEYWDINRPQDYASNARKWTAKAVAKVGASIKAFGWRQPLVVDTEGVIVIGHLRRQGGKSVGETQCPVHVARDLSPEQIRALRLADNRLSEESVWDMDLLKIEFGELKALDFGLTATGFDTREIDRLTLRPSPAEDDVPPVPVAPVSEAGDLWLMGEHRLLCGDSTKGEGVARVMAGQRAGPMNTDPPYGVSLRLEDNHAASNAAKGIGTKYRHFETIMGDDLEGEQLQSFLEAIFAAAIEGALRLDAAWYLWHAQLTQGFFAAAAAAAAAQLLIHRQIIWVKPHFVFGRGDYHWRHELCFYGWRKGNRPPFLGQHNQSSVWDLAEGGGCIRKDQDHPTQKPVELFRRPILNHMQIGEICYEPFAGSGSQFIAAELTDRRCYGLEIDRAYCDVIVTRWQNLTGREATLEGHNGITFAHVKQGRRQRDEDAIAEEVHVAAEKANA